MLERDVMGKVKQGVECSVEGCTEKAVRSFSSNKGREAMQAVGARVKDERARRVYLCQKHYKVYKKQVKQDKKVDKWRFGA
jgi:hypothetical protein